MNALRIYGENYINGDCGYTLSSGSDTSDYLYDQLPVTQWSSVGSDDSTQETIEIVFKNWQGTEVNRTIDQLILLNHNIKAGGADYWSGGAWVAISDATFSANSAANLVLSFTAAVTTSRLRLRLDTTISAGAEKTIGELKACASIISGSQLWLSEFTKEHEDKAGNYRLAGGALVQWREFSKFGGELLLDNVSKTDRDLLFPCLTAGGWLTLVLYYDHDPSAVYEVAVVGPPFEILDRKTGLYQLRLEVKER